MSAMYQALFKALYIQQPIKSLQQPYVIAYIIFPILKMRKLRNREVKQFDQGYTASNSSGAKIQTQTVGFYSLWP